MTENEQIQISYENNSQMLSAKTEQLIQTNLLKLLNNTGNGEKVISLFFCEAATIRQLNQSYRNIDKETDILSWSYENDENYSDSETWGELAVCLDVCKKQAKASDWPLETELLRLLVHGLGHLMGYDHELSEQDEEQMLAMEKKWLSSINMDGLYD